MQLFRKGVGFFVFSFFFFFRKKGKWQQLCVCFSNKGNIWIQMKENESEVAQLCLTFCDPIDCSLSGSSVHGIFQARILEWGAISFSRRSSWPRDWTQVSRIVSRHFTVWATREVQKKWKSLPNIYMLWLFRGLPSFHINNWNHGQTTLKMNLWYVSNSIISMIWSKRRMSL